MIFAQVIVFHPYFMEIAISISMWLQLSNDAMVAQNCLKNSANQFFQANIMDFSK